MDSEVVRVDGAQCGSSALRSNGPTKLERLIASLDVGGRQLEAVRRYVTIGAGAAVHGCHRPCIAACRVSCT
jgi:hypothetical protein